MFFDSTGVRGGREKAFLNAKREVQIQGRECGWVTNMS